jgi:hypothetical protein
MESDFTWAYVRLRLIPPVTLAHIQYCSQVASHLQVRPVHTFALYFSLFCVQSHLVNPSEIRIVLYINYEISNTLLGFGEHKIYIYSYIRGTEFQQAYNN